MAWFSIYITALAFGIIVATRGQRWLNDAPLSILKKCQPLGGGFCNGASSGYVYVFRKVAHLKTVVQALTRAGAGILSKVSF